VYFAKTYHFDLPQSFIAVILEVVHLLVVDAHFTKEQLRGQSQCERAASSHFWPNDDFTTLGNLVLQDLGFGKLLLLIGSQPDVRKSALLEREIPW
jgi:hypothetical protein